MLGNTVHPFEQSVTGKRCWDLITRHLRTVAQLPEYLHRKLTVSSGHHHGCQGRPHCVFTPAPTEESPAMGETGY